MEQDLGMHRGEPVTWTGDTSREHTKDILHSQAFSGEGRAPPSQSWLVGAQKGKDIPMAKAVVGSRILGLSSP